MYECMCVCMYMCVFICVYWVGIMWNEYILWEQIYNCEFWSEKEEFNYYWILWHEVYLFMVGLFMWFDGFMDYLM